MGTICIGKIKHSWQNTKVFVRNSSLLTKLNYQDSKNILIIIRLFFNYYNLQSLWISLFMIFSDCSNILEIFEFIPQPGRSPQKCTLWHICSSLSDMKDYINLQSFLFRLRQRMKTFTWSIIQWKYKGPIFVHIKWRMS